jgi:gas vesicle protein
MDWLKTLAPLLGTALGGPLGGAAASFIADKLGIENKTIEAVSEVLNNGKLTPDQIAAVKLAEIDFQKFCKQNAIDLEKVHADDRGSARQLLATVRSKMPAILSLVVTAGYFGILIGMMLGALKVTDSQALLIMLGSLSTAWGMVMAFWFGTTSGSTTKTELLANSTPVK